MTPGFPLDAAEHQRIEKLYKAERDHRLAKRLLMLLWLHQGYDQGEVARLLLVERRTVRQWLQLYRTKGLDTLCELQYTGDPGELATTQQQQLKDEIKTGRFRSVKEIVAWIHDTFFVIYSVSGVTRLLRRLGCTYHKASGFLFKAERQAQKTWLDNYVKDKKKVSKTLRRYFLDGVHPVWGQDTLFSCWLLRGQRLEAPLGSGRKRLNILGAFCPDDHEYLDRRYVKENLNAQSVIDLFTHMMAQHPEVKVFIIYLDNAKYQHAVLVRDWLKQTQDTGVEFRLTYLPPYSPNLNLIERLWKFLRKEACRKWHPTFDGMVAAIAGVLDNLANYRLQLKTLMTEKFRLVPERAAPAA